MAQLSDSVDRKLGVQILQARADELKTAATAISTAAATMLSEDAEGQFADETAMDTAFVGLRDQYYALEVSGLGDVSDLYDVTLPETEE